MARGATITNSTQSLARDYHALAGFLQSSDYRQVRFDSIEANRRIADRLARIDREHEGRVRRAIVRGLSQAGLERLQDTVSSRGAACHKPNIDDYRVLVDYARHAKPMQDGYCFAVRQPGDLRLTAEGMRVVRHAAAVADPFWCGLENQSEPATNGAGDLNPVRRSGRTLRTETVELTTGNVRLLVSGRGEAFACVDSHRLLEGPLHRDTVIRFEPPGGPSGPYWVDAALGRYAGAKVHFEFTPTAENDLHVLAIVEDTGPRELAG